MTPVELGLGSNDLRGHRMVFDPLSRSIVVQIWTRREDCDWGRIFLREYPQAVYRVVGDPEDDCSDSSLIWSGGRYFFFLRARGEILEHGWGFRDECIVRLCATSGACEFFRLSSMAAPGRFIASIHGATPDGSAVCVVTGRELQDKSTVYTTGVLDLGSGTLSDLVELPAVFV